MQNKEKRKLEILLELRKYISDEFIIGDIDEISSDTIVSIKHEKNIDKLLLYVTKNCIFLNKSFYLDDLKNLSILCPKFKLINQEHFNQTIIFFNTYINYFSNKFIFDSSNIFKDSLIEIFNNDFYTHLITDQKIILTERKITYKNTISLYNKKGCKQDFIVESNGNGNLNISIDFEGQLIKQPYIELKEKDYLKYFLISNSNLFEKLKFEYNINENKKFEDIKKALYLLEILDF